MFRRLYGTPPSRRPARAYSTDIDDGNVADFSGDVSMANAAFDSPFVDSDKGTLVFWINNRTLGQDKSFMSAGSASTTFMTALLHDPPSRLRVSFKNAAGTEVILVTSLNTEPFINGDEWTCAMLSWDLSVPVMRLYINDVESLLIATLTQGGVIKYSDLKWEIGSGAAGGNFAEMSYRTVYFNMVEFIDFELEANRRKFLSLDGSPTELGADGSIPTGNVPQIFVQGNSKQFRQNRGTGFDFTSSFGAGRVKSLRESVIADRSERVTMHQSFAGSESLEDAVKTGPLLVLVRDSETATRFNSSGILETLGAHVPRFDHTVNDGVARGILTEPLATNRALWNRDWTNAAWVKSNMGTAKDATGLDAEVNSATTLTATAANATILQSLTFASAARAFTVYVKRVTGVGDIDITIDGGVTWVTLTGLDTSDWTRHKVTQTVLDPQFGVRIVVDTDAVEVDFAQHEDTAYATSPLATTTSVAVRQKDALLTTDVSWFNVLAGDGTIFARASMPDVVVNNRLFSIGDGSLDNRLILIANAGPNAQFFIITTRGNARNAQPTGSINWANAVEKKVAMAFQFEDVNAHEGGAAIGTDATVDMVEGVTTLHVGADPLGELRGPTHIAELLYWNYRRSTSALAGITA